MARNGSGLTDVKAIRKIRELNKRVPIFLQNHFSVDHIMDKIYKLQYMEEGKGNPVITDFESLSKLDVEIAILVKQENPVYKRFVEKIGGKEPKVFSDGFDPNFLNPDLKELAGVSKESLGFDKNVPLILFPARIITIKGHLDMIEIIDELRKDITKFKVVCIGSTHDFPNFIRKVREGLEKKGLSDYVEFKDPVSSAKLREYYKVSDVVMLPTHFEAFGRVLLESQLMKTPVVAYDVGGVHKAMKDKKTGFLIPENDIQSFVDKIKQLLTDKVLYNKMAKAGRCYVEENYSILSVTKKLEQYYFDLIKRAA